MVVLLSSFLKGFSESFLTPTILPCTEDERDENITKWFRKYIF
jgi:hypothetical protein